MVSCFLRLIPVEIKSIKLIPVEIRHEEVHYDLNQFIMEYNECKKNHLRGFASDVVLSCHQCVHTLETCTFLLDRLLRKREMTLVSSQRRVTCR